MEYLYDSNFDNEAMKEGRLLAEKKGIESIDTASWDEDKKWDYYLHVLMPISVRFHRKMKGRIRTHKAGFIHLDSVLVTDDNFYVGEEALEKLRDI